MERASRPEVAIELSLPERRSIAFRPPETERYQYDSFIDLLYSTDWMAHTLTPSKTVLTPELNQLPAQSTDDPPALTSAPAATVTTSALASVTATALTALRDPDAIATREESLQTLRRTPWTRVSPQMLASTEGWMWRVTRSTTAAKGTAARKKSAWTPSRTSSPKQVPTTVAVCSSVPREPVTNHVNPHKRSAPTAAENSPIRVLRSETAATAKTTAVETPKTAAEAAVKGSTAPATRPATADASARENSPRMPPRNPPMFASAGDSWLWRVSRSTAVAEGTAARKKFQKAPSRTHRTPTSPSTLATADNGSLSHARQRLRLQQRAKRRRKRRSRSRSSERRRRK